MYHYLIALRCEGHHALAGFFERLGRAALRSRHIDRETRKSLLAHLEVLARESVLPARSRHRPAQEAAVMAVSAATAGDEALYALWEPLRRRMLDVTWSAAGAVGAVRPRSGRRRWKASPSAAARPRQAA